MESLILASKSARRRELLTMLGARFEVIAIDTDESEPDGIEPDALVRDLARRKLEAVRKKAGSERIIIAADTIVWCAGEIFGKPRDIDDARHMLIAMSGSFHEVLTGIAVSRGDTVTVECERTRVYFRKLGADEIERYIATAEVTDKAGAYGIQERAGLFVERIEGDYFNIVGLPICRLGVILRRDFGVEL